MSKTPVSALQEFCMKKKIIPQYNVNTLKPGKEYECHLSFDDLYDDIMVTGSGKSKKEAKHYAANEALKLIVLSLENNGYNCNKYNVINMSDIKSPYADRIKENYIGKLKEVCIVNILPLPEYSTVTSRGRYSCGYHDGIEMSTISVSLSRQPFYRMQCQVASLTEIGLSNTKREARQIAASFMINKIKNTLKDKFVVPDPMDFSAGKEILDGQNQEKCNDNDIKNSDEKNEKTFSVFFERYKSVIKKQKVNMKVNILDYINIASEEEFFTMTYALNTKLKELSEKEIQSYSNPKMLLEDICQLSEFEFGFIKYNNYKKDDNRVFVGVEVRTCPAWVAVGQGTTEQQAKNNAIKNILLFLKCLIM